MGLFQEVQGTLFNTGITFWEGGGGLSVDSPCMCACDFETLRGTSDEWVGGVFRWLESA